MTVTNATRELKAARYSGFDYQGKVVGLEQEGGGEGGGGGGGGGGGSGGQGGGDKKAQRVRIRIEKLHDSIENDSDIPWSYPKANNGSANSSGGLGNVNVPPMGSTVALQLMDESHYHPQYAVGPTTTNVENKELTKKNYPHVPSNIDRSGNKNWNDTKEDHSGYTHVSGGGVERDAYGHTQVNVNSKKPENKDGKKKFEVPGSVHVNGNAEIVCGGDAVVSAKGKVQVIAGGDATISAKGVLKLIGKSIEASGILKCLSGIEWKSAKGPTPSGSGSGSATGALEPKAVRKMESRKRPEEKANEGGPKGVASGGSGTA